MKKFMLFLFTLIVIVFYIATPTIAISSDKERFFIKNNIIFYDDNDNSNDCYKIPTNESKENAIVISEKLMKILLDDEGKKINPQSAKILTAAIIGNMKHESGYNPKSLNRRDCNENKSSCYASFGLSQWRAGRFIALMKFANQYDEWNKNGNFGENGWQSSEVPDVDIDTQLKFLYKELKISYEKSVLDPILNLDNENISLEEKVEEATIIYGSNFEVFAGHDDSDNPSRINRIKTAKSFLSLIDTGTFDNCNMTPTANLGNFKVFKQTDPRWNVEPYAGGFIGDSGCGPTSLATILINLKLDPPKNPPITIPSTINPSTMVQTIRKYDDSKIKIGPQVEYEGEGSSIYALTKLSEKLYNTETIALGTDEAKINKALRDGYLVITNGTGSLPYTRYGHIFPILGINEKGKWVIGQTADYLTDPGLEGWLPSEVIGSTKMNSAYGIKEKK